MLATIKISPTFKDYFNELEYKVAVESYYDIEFYLRSMHKRFGDYITQIKSGQSQEGFAYLDENLEVVNPQTFPLKKIKDGDTIYIAPVVCGAGGKKGFIFAAVAIAAVVAAGPLGFGLYGAGAGAPATFGTGLMYGPAAGGASTGLFGSLGAAFSGLPSFVQGILGNLALSAIGMLFTSKPKQRQQEVTKDSGTRTENNMFGSLQNTTTSGTPIPLNYGVMRVAGQFLSGYVLSTEHGQDNSPSVESIFVADSTPLATATPNDE